MHGQSKQRRAPVASGIHVTGAASGRLALKKLNAKEHCGLLRAEVVARLQERGADALTVAKASKDTITTLKKTMKEKEWVDSGGYFEPKTEGLKALLVTASSEDGEES